MGKDLEKKGGFKRLLKGLKSEFAKIAWPKKDSLRKQTIAVLATSVFLGAIIALLDMIFKYGIDFLAKL